MRALRDIVTGSAEADTRTLTLHLVAKAVLVIAMLLVLWGLEYQSAVVYEAF